VQKSNEGEDIEVAASARLEFEICRDRSREAALERLRKLRRPFPADFTFERIAANER
jgi:antitoxin MazE